VCVVIGFLEPPKLGLQLFAGIGCPSSYASFQCQVGSDNATCGANPTTGASSLFINLIGQKQIYIMYDSILIPHHTCGMPHLLQGHGCKWSTGCLQSYLLLLAQLLPRPLCYTDCGPHRSRDSLSLPHCAVNLQPDAAAHHTMHHRKPTHRPQRWHDVSAVWATRKSRWRLVRFARGAVRTQFTGMHELLGICVMVFSHRIVWYCRLTFCTCPQSRVTCV
jgi:hypothetical protein